MRSRRSVCLAILLLASPVTMVPGAATPPLATAPSAAAAGSVPEKVAAAIGSVVSVRVREVVKRPAWRNGRFETREIAGMGAGSGVIIGEDGRILTNAHVVAGAVEVRVRHASGREETARVTAIDEASDLAIIRASGSGYKPLAFSTAGVPSPGAPVFIVGNLGNKGPGIDSGRIGQRRLVRVGARPIEFWAEVEAPIGPGDSGGAILNAAGELVGVPGLQIVDPESADPADAPPADGLRTSGLFIPAAHALRSAQKMSRAPRPDWPFIGLVLEDPLLAAGPGRAGKAESGPAVRHILAGSPAEKAGLRRGDRLVTIAGRPVRDNFEALDAVLDLAVGAEVTLEVERSGQTETLQLITGLRPDDPRPDPFDDFYLHTGIHLTAGPAARGGQAAFALDSMSREASGRMAEPELQLFRERPSLGALLPGAEMLGGSTRRHPVATTNDLAGLIGRCFVEDQFVALIHWDLGGGRSIDRAHVHRKIHPVIL